MITRYSGCPHYTVIDKPGCEPIGEIAQHPGDPEWIFWPSVYRKPVSLKIAGEIMAILEELNNKSPQIKTDKS